jgi:hypothetical protein
MEYWSNGPRVLGNTTILHYSYIPFPRIHPIDKIPDRKYARNQPHEYQAF